MRALQFLLVAGVALAVEPQRVVLVQELIRVEAMEQKTLIQFPLQQQGAELEVKYESKRGGEGVRVAIYSTDSNVPVGGTTYEINGTLRVPLTRERVYRVEIENRRQRLGHALVDVEATLVFGVRTEAPPASAARELDPKRRLYTIATSLSLFALLVAYSAIRLTPPILERMRGQR